MQTHWWQHFLELKQCVSFLKLLLNRFTGSAWKLYWKITKSHIFIVGLKCFQWSSNCYVIKTEHGFQKGTLGVINKIRIVNLWVCDVRWTALTCHQNTFAAMSTTAPKSPVDPKSPPLPPRTYNLLPESSPQTSTTPTSPSATSMTSPTTSSGPVPTPRRRIPPPPRSTAHIDPDSGYPETRCNFLSLLFSLKRCYACIFWSKFFTFYL